MECGHKFSICRLCLYDGESFIDIFQVNEWFGYVPADVVADLLQVQVSETDGYPQVVCSICLGKLKDFKQFKEQCQNSRDTYNNVIASYKSHAEHPADIVPSGTIKTEVEQETNDVDATTEVELSPVKLEPEDRLDSQEAHQEVRKCSVALTSLEYLEGDQKTTCCEFYGPYANVKVEEMDIKVKRECISPGGRKDMLPDEESDLNRVESSDIEMRRGTIEIREEAIRVDTSVDVTREDEGILEFKIERNSDAERGSAREREEEAPVGVEEREEKREHFSCHDCGKGFQEKDVLIRHLELHGYVVNEESCIEERDSQVDANVNCGTKPKTSDSPKTGLKGKMSDKVKTDKGFRKYVCDSCGKGFIWISDLKRHLLVHSREKPFACAVCGKCFSEKPALRKHNFIHTGQKPYPCAVCGRHFARKFNLKKHERIHSGEKPFTCEVCGMHVVRKYNLKGHRCTHGGEKLYECETCGKMFSHNYTLKSHRRLHSEEKYTCEVCGIHFANRNTLKSHIRIHTGEKPYKCDVCGKTFSQNGTLTRHKRVHSGEKPFSCKVCGRCFSVRFNLSKHLRVHSR